MQVLLWVDDVSYWFWRKSFLSKVELSILVVYIFRYGCHVCSVYVCCWQKSISILTFNFLTMHFEIGFVCAWARSRDSIACLIVSKWRMWMYRFQDRFINWWMNLLLCHTWSSYLFTHSRSGLNHRIIWLSFYTTSILSGIR